MYDREEDIGALGPSSFLDMATQKNHTIKKINVPDDKWQVFFDADVVGGDDPCGEIFELKCARSAPVHDWKLRLHGKEYVLGSDPESTTNQVEFSVETGETISSTFDPLVDGLSVIGIPFYIYTERGPRLDTRRIPTVDHDRITLIYDQDIDPGHTPPTSALLVTVNGNNVAWDSISIAKNVMTITLSQPVSPGDDVRLTYDIRDVLSRRADTEHRW